MLDTIAINLQRDAFDIEKPERFSPTADYLVRAKATKRLLSSKYNPSKHEQMIHGYLPYLTLYRKPFGTKANALWLRIEFSAPKLIFGNNFEELSDGHFKSVANALLKALNVMGVITTYEALINAKVAEIHYSKNVILDRNTPCHMIIRMLEKADMSNRLDLSQSDFRNGGQMAKYHTGTYEIAIYDKVKDLQQARNHGEKRGAEKNYFCQYDLFYQKYAQEILRLEIRLKSKKVEPLFEKLKIHKTLTLKSLYSKQIALVVLNYYWQEIKNAIYVQHITDDHEKLIYNIRKTFPRKKANSVTSLFGFIVLAKTLGMRGSKLSLNLSNAQYYRFKKDAKDLEKDNKCPRFMAVVNIQNQLKDFMPLSKNDLYRT